MIYKYKKKKKSAYILTNVDVKATFLQCQTRKLCKALSAQRENQKEIRGNDYWTDIRILLDKSKKVAMVHNSH